MDRNGEPSEADWGCVFILVCLAGVIVTVGLALAASAITDAW